MISTVQSSIAGRSSVTSEAWCLKFEASGEFFEFPPGENILRIKSVFSDDITTTVYFTPKFMYDVDLSNIDWGDENA